MRFKKLPDLAYLNTILDYNPETGELRWKVDIGKMKTKNKIAGTKTSLGYFQVQIKSTIYLSHRIIYYMITGIDPKKLDIDHINGNPSDNKISNLRITTRSQNLQNAGKSTKNNSGFKGVCYDKTRNLYSVDIRFNNQRIRLGRYKTAFYAALVYARAAKKYCGEYRRKKA